MTASTPLTWPLFVHDHGDPAPARGDDDHPPFKQVLHHPPFQNPQGIGGGHHPAVMLAFLVLDPFEDHSAVFFIFFHLRLGVERPHRFGGIPESRVLPVHHHLGNEGDHVAAQAGVLQFVEERLLDHEADLPLAHGPADVQRQGRNRFGALFLLNQQVSHLGPVPVGDDDPITALMILTICAQLIFTFSYCSAAVPC